MLSPVLFLLQLQYLCTCSRLLAYPLKSLLEFVCLDEVEDLLEIEALLMLMLLMIDCPAISILLFWMGLFYLLWLQ